MKQRFLLLCLTAALGMSAVCPVYADAATPYLSLGEDLSDEELSTVLSIFGIDEEDLDTYDVSYVTNEDEHEYLDEYLDDSTIGSRALSCVLVTEAEEGSGITVTTTNISYVTSGMYENALTTAGVTDAEVVVAGPFSISGTAALVGAALAYSEMTGEDVDEEAVDAAIEEVVVTGEIMEDSEDEDVIEGVIAYVKSEAVGEDLSEDELDDVLDDAEEIFEVSLSEEDRELIKDLIEKIDGLNIDGDTFKEQAESIYEDLTEKGYDLDFDINSGFFGRIREKLSNIFSVFSRDDGTEEETEENTDDTDADAEDDTEVADADTEETGTDDGDTEEDTDHSSDTEDTDSSSDDESYVDEDIAESVEELSQMGILERIIYRIRNFF